MRKPFLLQAVELSFVLVVSTAMYAYGFGKYVQFADPAGSTGTIAGATGMELMWAFYGYSKPYALLLGALEVAGATLLLVRRTRVIGGLLLVGILGNVIAQDIFFEVNCGALRAAVIYLTLVMVLLWFNRATLIAATRAVLLGDRARQTWAEWAAVVALAVTLAALVKAGEYVVTH